MRSKIRALVNSRQLANIKLALSLAKSLGKYHWIQEDYINLFEQIRYVEKFNMNLFEQIHYAEKDNIKENSIPDIKKIAYLQGLKNIELRSFPENYLLTGQIEETLKLDRLTIKHTKPENIPTFFFKIKTLHKLYLSNNQLECLPKEIGGLTSLTTLYIDGNRLDALPNELLKLEKLSTLQISSNRFEKIPSVLYQMKSLRHLYIVNNKILKEEIKQFNKILPNCRVGVTGGDLPF